jgi:bifunctional non-homologous end joining protein LigD
LEGVVSKKIDGPYRPGKSKTWLKSKCFRLDEFVIVGFRESKATGGLAALLLAEITKDGLHYVGKVGTGFTERDAGLLLDRIRKLSRHHPPRGMSLGPGDSAAVWVKPNLLAMVRYSTRTADEFLHHPVYRGIRPAS